jgi:glycosyltransferase involved in cell wall biosynthesis
MDAGPLQLANQRPKAVVIGFDISNLTMSTERWVRTGIQEVGYQVLLSLLQEIKNGQTHCRLIPYLSEGAGNHPETPPAWLSGLIREHGLSEEAVLGEDFTLEGLHKSLEARKKQILGCSIFHIQSLCNISALPQGPRLSVALMDLGPVRFPEFCPPRVPAWFQGEYLKSINDRVSTVIAISRATAIDFHEYSPNFNGKIHYLTLPSELGSPNSDKNIFIDSEYVLFLGTQEPRKNLEAALEGFEEYHRRFAGSPLEFHIAGNPGWKNSRFMSQVRSSSVRNKIRFLGYVPDEELPSRVSCAIALIFVSYFEGFGIPAAIARKLGTPVVTSLSSSLPEAALEEAIYCDPSRAQSIAAAIEIARSSRLSKKPPPSPTTAQLFSWRNYVLELLGAFKADHLA